MVELSDKEIDVLQGILRRAKAGEEKTPPKPKKESNRKRIERAKNLFK